MRIRKFFYRYQDISDLLNLSVSRVKHLVSEGKLKPTLQGVVEYYNYRYARLIDSIEKHDDKVARSFIKYKPYYVKDRESKSLNNRVWEKRPSTGGGGQK